MRVPSPRQDSPARKPAARRGEPLLFARNLEHQAGQDSRQDSPAWKPAARRGEPLLFAHPQRGGQRAEGVLAAAQERQRQQRKQEEPETTAGGPVTPVLCLCVQIRSAAANVLRECWLLHRSGRGRRDSGENRRNQRRLLEAIRVFREARLKQRKLRDHANEMVDLSKLQVMMSDLNGNWSTSYKEMERRIVSMEQKMDELSRAFQETSQLISRALQHRAGGNSVA
ncbi:Small conductance calcium-activated potassium channel protein 3 [Acipenser ruthenus]|uniref:Small conductance calcium-activated potassium channel protein 3 n=1 Tax=Acipenser ruthenus TaxID=7906 RepID=A0A444U2F5_ACIRT|nr:Small conductance calcium-activated potassium channel protein 3 [Acipenser ruthenus]